MKIHILYISRYGNGQKCAEYLGKVLKQKGQDVEVHSMKEVNPKKIPEADVYIFSSPTHIKKPPIKVRRFLKRVRIQSRNTRYALMATVVGKQMKTVNIMEKFLEHKDIMKAAKSIQIRVGGLRGPLEKDYQKKLENFASEIIKS